MATPARNRRGLVVAVMVSAVLMLAVAAVLCGLSVGGVS